MSRNRQSARTHDAASVPHPRGPLIAATAIGLGALAVYLATLAPTVLDGDDGELVAAAHVLGVAHPTGYPLYLLVAKLFTLLPFGTVAARVALFSAVSGACAAAMIAWATAKLARSAPAGVLAGAIAAFNEPMWSQAARVEVYALNACFIALAIALFVRWDEHRTPAGVVGLAFVAGIGLAHHRTSAFFTIPLLAAAAILSRPRVRDLLKAACAAALPLLLYLYIPIRAAARPSIIWFDMPPWELLAYEVAGGQYYELFAFARPGVEVVSVGIEFARTLATGLTVGGVALALLGLMALFRRSRALGACLLFSATVLTIWNLGYYVHDWHVFFMPIYVAAGVWAGIGLAELSRFVDAALASRMKAAAPVLTALVLALVPVSLLQCNWAKCNYRNTWKYYDAARAILAQLPPDAVCVSLGEDFNLVYLQVIDGKRPDVTVMFPFGQFTSRIADSEIRSLAPSLAKEHAGDASYTDPSSESRATLSFAMALAEAIEWRRPVFASVDVAEPPNDPLLRALWWNLYQIAPEQVNLLVPASGDRAIRQLQNGIALGDLTVEPAAVRPRELVNIAFDWVCTEPVTEAPFVVARLSPAGDEGARREDMLGDYPTWFAYGQTPLDPTPTESVYRQSLTAMAPTNAEPGTWYVWMALAPGPRADAAFWRAAEFQMLPAQ